MCSLARVDRKHANECTTGSSPRSAIPPAADTMCCSAMPHSMNRSGSSALNASMPERFIECGIAEQHMRSEEHTSELRSHHDLVCRLLLDKKKRVRIRQ